jgi:hypothetical protein
MKNSTDVLKLNENLSMDTVCEDKFDKYTDCLAEFGPQCLIADILQYNETLTPSQRNLSNAFLSAMGKMFELRRERNNNAGEKAPDAAK